MKPSVYWRYSGKSQNTHDTKTDRSAGDRLLSSLTLGAAATVGAVLPSAAAGETFPCHEHKEEGS